MIVDGHIEREVVIRARPEKVIQYLTQPELIVKWFGTSATLEPEPGGLYDIQVTEDAHALGAFTEVNANRVVHTFGWVGSTSVPPASSRVTFDLVDEGEFTRVKLTHDRLPPDELAQHDAGWGMYFTRLSELDPA